jgi:hypothetical protein
LAFGLCLAQAAGSRTARLAVEAINLWSIALPTFCVGVAALLMVRPHQGPVFVFAAVTLQLRVRNARPCAGLVRGTVSLTPAEGIATLVASGRVAPAANNVPRVLLVCAQGGESAACTETPVR